MSQYFSGLIIILNLTFQFAHAEFSAQQTQQLDQKMQLFLSSEAGAQKVMNALPAKRTHQGKKKSSQFSNEDIVSQEFVAKKAKFRRAQMGISPAGREGWQNHDDASDLVDNSRSMVTNLVEMDKKNLERAALKTNPWSDSYWPIFQGALGARYADKSFPNDDNWKKNFTYVDTYSLPKILEKFGFQPKTEEIDDLSPAEKYDLLIGDGSGGLTRAILTETQWQEGAEYYDNNGKVEKWMGKCHGWAPAAYMLPRPQKSVVVTAANGKSKIKFYPSDIKALGTLLWATVDTESRFIGGRCDVKNPKKDRNGRVIEDQCRDNNAGTWHLAVVNQLGVSKRSFVIDMTYDYEVWNQPVLSYEYTYFNVETGKTVKSLKNAIVPLNEFSKNKFPRDPKTKSVVGVHMNLTYVIETDPSHRETDSVSHDNTTTVVYTYDLELDADEEIIGGEWYSNLHPDFMWTPPKRARPHVSSAEKNLGRWDARSELPSDWQQLGAAAAKQGKPLGRIVEFLFAKSSK